MTEPVTEKFTRAYAADGEIVFTPIAVDAIEAHPLWAASNLSVVNRRRVLGEAGRAWVATTAWLATVREHDPPAVAAVVVWFKPGPAGYDGIFLTAVPGAKRQERCFGVTLLRDGTYRLLTERRLGESVSGIVEAEPHLSARSIPRTAGISAGSSPEDGI